MLLCLLICELGGESVEIAVLMLVDSVMWLANSTTHEVIPGGGLELRSCCFTNSGVCKSK